VWNPTIRKYCVVPFCLLIWKGILGLNLVVCMWLDLAMIVWVMIIRFLGWRSLEVGEEEFWVWG
jgi:hypothetical protein